MDLGGFLGIFVQIQGENPLCGTKLLYLLRVKCKISIFVLILNRGKPLIYGQKDSGLH